MRVYPLSSPPARFALGDPARPVRTFFVRSAECRLSRVGLRASYLLPSSRRIRSMYSTLSSSAPPTCSRVTTPRRRHVRCCRFEIYTEVATMLPTMPCNWTRNSQHPSHGTIGSIAAAAILSAYMDPDPTSHMAYHGC